MLPILGGSPYGYGFEGVLAGSGDSRLGPSTPASIAARLALPDSPLYPPLPDEWRPLRRPSSASATDAAPFAGGAAPYMGPPAPVLRPAPLIGSRVASARSSVSTTVPPLAPTRARGRPLRGLVLEPSPPRHHPPSTDALEAPGVDRPPSASGISWGQPPPSSFRGLTPAHPSSASSLCALARLSAQLLEIQREISKHQGRIVHHQGRITYHQAEADRLSQQLQRLLEEQGQAHPLYAAGGGVPTPESTPKAADLRGIMFKRGSVSRSAGSTGAAARVVAFATPLLGPERRASAELLERPGTVTPVGLPPARSSPRVTAGVRSQALHPAASLPTAPALSSAFVTSSPEEAKKNSHDNESG